MIIRMLFFIQKCLVNSYWGPTCSLVKASFWYESCRCSKPLRARHSTQHMVALDAMIFDITTSFSISAISNQNPIEILVGLGLGITLIPHYQPKPNPNRNPIPNTQTKTPNQTETSPNYQYWVLGVGFQYQKNILKNNQTTKVFSPVVSQVGSSCNSERASQAESGWLS